ncbi:hypothetical protein CLOSTASPAR_04524 [[Clostridium] asparagiforme DSM 15981]|uniref:Uncharacterized protein n=1 Tax=[Clostridium] asparagiforme DSM 15981 TaxID=518636 RepID=C0D5H8_9FIRM|nr:hypothetical protein CLOSTASPAR_04524 [[Clostridium] asparagiforme DSM 15981]
MGEPLKVTVIFQTVAAMEVPEAVPEDTTIKILSIIMLEEMVVATVKMDRQKANQPLSTLIGVVQVKEPRQEHGDLQQVLYMVAAVAAVESEWLINHMLVEREVLAAVVQEVLAVTDSKMDIRAKAVLRILEAVVVRGADQTLKPTEPVEVVALGLYY